jgi:DNA-binding MarR family transcriptional regulator
MPMARRLLAARLITLLKLLYRSASPAYRTATRLSDFEWRVLMQVGDHGPVVLTALATLLHQDKGQVSHAVKSLVDAKLLTREHLRAPLRLTPNGQALFDRIVKLGRVRNAALIRELTGPERRALPRLVLKLRTNAHALLVEEQALRSLEDEPGDVGGPESGTPLARRVAIDGKSSGAQHRLVAQDLFALQNLLLRSAALTFRREVNLSDFEWRVLSQVGEHAPLTLIQLVPLLSRDKSQVGRTLARLAGRGLLTREKIGGGRHVLVDISPQGRAVYAQLAELALTRNAALIEGLSARDQQMFMAILDKVTAGATALLGKREKV